MATGRGMLEFSFPNPFFHSFRQITEIVLKMYLRRHLLLINDNNLLLPFSKLEKEMNFALYLLGREICEWEGKCFGNVLDVLDINKCARGWWVCAVCVLWGRWPDNDLMLTWLSHPIYTHIPIRPWSSQPPSRLSS